MRRAVQADADAMLPKQIRHRRDIGQMRHIAEQESLKAERHRDEVTANNIKALQ